MAFRLDEQLLRGEIDNRQRDRVIGTLWFINQPEPVHLDLQGNCWRDLAGRLIRITNTKPVPGKPDRLYPDQHGQVGDMTASRKVRVPEVSIEEMMQSHGDYPWHWGNCVYLEWFSQRNGRVVLESVDYQVEVVGLPAWEMTEAEEQAQMLKNQEGIIQFMNRMTEAIEAERCRIDEQIEKDRATSSIEADADAHDAKMNIFHDRVEARLHACGDAATPEDHERIMDEEMDRLRRERGEPDPEDLTPEQQAEYDAWIEEMNRISEEALADDNPMPEPKRHPLQEQCFELGIAIRHAFRDHGWLAEGSSAEHPLREIADGVQIAGAKLAGALTTYSDEDWPPNPMFAGDKLVRLKKARRHLQDALDGMDAAEEQRLADAEWRIRTRHNIKVILLGIEQLIEEVRAVCEEAEGEDDET